MFTSKHNLTFHIRRSHTVSVPDCSAICPIRELFPVSGLPGRLYQDPPQWSSSEKTMIRHQPSHNSRHLLLEMCLWRGCQGPSPVQNQAGSSITLDWSPLTQATNYCPLDTKLFLSLTWFSTTWLRYNWLTVLIFLFLRLNFHIQCEY